MDAKLNGPFHSEAVPAEPSLDTRMRAERPVASPAPRRKEDGGFDKIKLELSFHFPPPEDDRVG